MKSCGPPKRAEKRTSFSCRDFWSRTSPPPPSCQSGRLPHAVPWAAWARAPAEAPEAVPPPPGDPNTHDAPPAVAD